MRLVPHDPIVLVSLFHPQLCLFCMWTSSCNSCILWLLFCFGMTVHNHRSGSSVRSPDSAAILLVDCGCWPLGTGQSFATCPLLWQLKHFTAFINVSPCCWGLAFAVRITYIPLCPTSVAVSSMARVWWPVCCSSVPSGGFLPGFLTTMLPLLKCSFCA